MAVGGAIGATALALGIAGTVFFGGNLVGDSSQNPNPSYIVGTKAYETPITATSTATGGVTTYDTLLIATPYSTTAPTFGLRTGTGIIKSLQLDIIANPAAAKIDCSVVNAVKTATGGTALVQDASASGSIAVYYPSTSTSPITLGPTQFIKCGTVGTITSSFSARLTGILSDSDVIN